MRSLMHFTPPHIIKADRIRATNEQACLSYRIIKWGSLRFVTCLLFIQNAAQHDTFRSHPRELLPHGVPQRMPQSEHAMIPASHCLEASENVFREHVQTHATIVVQHTLIREPLVRLKLVITVLSRGIHELAFHHPHTPAGRIHWLLREENVLWPLQRGS